MLCPDFALMLGALAVPLRGDALDGEPAIESSLYSLTEPSPTSVPPSDGEVELLLKY